MLANTKKHDLINHLKATANLSMAMANHLGLSKELIYRVFVAGLLHDIGKAVPSFQNYISGSSILIIDEDFQDPIIGFPLHHEIGWAYLIEKTGDDRILNAIYWHHARPIHPDGNKKTKTYESAAQILETLSDADRKALDALWLLLLPLIPTNLLGNMKYGNIDVPPLFVSDGSLNQNFNAEFMLIRACVISADRHISALNQFAVDHLSENLEAVSNEMIAMLSGSIEGTIIKPEGYDQKRFNLQQSIVTATGDERTTIVKAPAGLGKTLIGILWSRLRSGKVLWVCPRNAVADAVYENIIKEVNALGLSCTVELFRTGKRQKANIEDGEPFTSDIIVTNIDAIMSPMVNNVVAGRLFMIYGACVILDEFHEFVSDAPLFAAFITYMRARHRLANNCKTLLLSATPSLVHTLWDTEERKTLILPNETEHYAPQHMGMYQIAFKNSLPITAVPGSLLVCNSVSEAQDNFTNSGYKHIIHHRYTDKDRKIIEATINTFFGKGTKGISEGENLSAALVVQAALDISFKSLYDSVCSPESTLQRIGRIDRWGTFQTMKPSITFINLIGKKNEAGAIRTVYDAELQAKWHLFLTKELIDVTDVNLIRMYEIYNKFLQLHRKDVISYLREQYRVGMNGANQKVTFLALVEFFPKKLLNTDPEKKKKDKASYKSLRNPDGSYFYTVEIIGGKPNEWLPPDEVLSEGYELYARYAGNGQLTQGLLNSGAMLTRLKGLVTWGYKAWTKHSKGKQKIPSSLMDWFRRARDPETPLPDFSRKYDSELGVIRPKI